jgi:hypothetical protein
MFAGIPTDSCKIGPIPRALAMRPYSATSHLESYRKRASHLHFGSFANARLRAYNERDFSDPRSLTERNPTARRTSPLRFLERARVQAETLAPPFAEFEFLRVLERRRFVTPSIHGRTASRPNPIADLGFCFFSLCSAGLSRFLRPDALCREDRQGLTWELIRQRITTISRGLSS